MKEIKFNKNYKKLHNQDYAKLMYIEERFGKDLNKEFVEYDTEDEFKIDDNQLYMLLYFVGIDLIPFTTLRKSNEENREKYQVGKLYRIVIEQ